MLSEPYTKSPENLFYILAHDSTEDCAMYFSKFLCDENSVNAQFSKSYDCRMKFDSLVEAQAYCKVLCSKYVKNFVYSAIQPPINCLRESLEVAIENDKAKVYSAYLSPLIPIPIWSAASAV